MPRTAFLAIWGPSGSAVVAEALRRADADPEWRRAAVTDETVIWTSGRPELPVRHLPGGAGLVLGDLFRPPQPAPELPDSDRGPLGARAWARWLVRHRWGRYVALLRDADGRLSVLRDPSGLVDAMLWPVGGGVHLVTSDLRRVPRGLRPPRQSLNWDRIAAYLAAPANHTTEALFDGVTCVGPGELRPVAGQGPAELIWRPRDHLPKGAIDAEALQAELVRRVDHCTSCLAGTYARIDVEVSGGLDSAIVATSLHATGHAPRVAHWVNRAVRRAAGDERAYATAVTDQIGARLTSLMKSCAPLTQADLMALADGAWPGMNGVEAARDRADAERLAAHGVTALVSGQGGDAIFFQPPTPLVIADAWRTRGLAVLGSSLLPETARRTRQSVWAVLRALRNPTLSTSQTLSVVTPAAAELGLARTHAWTADALDADAPPAKRLQVQVIANHHVYHGDSRLRRVADEVFPLLAQPVVELCLSVSVPDLVGGGGDRPFARAAFAARLPAAIRERRSKGAQTAHFAQLVAASLPDLRPFLLEGNLAAAGVLDRAELERRLDLNDLMARPGASHLLWAAAVEAWVRYWQTQVPDAAGSDRWRR